jgi:hypothetical protein
MRSTFTAATTRRWAIFLNPPQRPLRWLSEERRTPEHSLFGEQLQRFSSIFLRISQNRAAGGKFGGNISAG